MGDRPFGVGDCADAVVSVDVAPESDAAGGCADSAVSGDMAPESDAAGGCADSAVSGDVIPESEAAGGRTEGSAAGAAARRLLDFLIRLQTLRDWLGHRQIRGVAGPTWPLFPGPAVGPRRDTPMTAETPMI